MIVVIILRLDENNNCTAKWILVTNRCSVYCKTFIYIDFTEDNRNCGFENQDLDLRLLVGFKHLNKMEAGRILEIFEESRVFVDNRSCNKLMHWLDYVENVLIDDDKTVLFRNRLNYICTANIFKTAMEREYGCKQILRFLKTHWHYDEPKAKRIADKLNSARRVYASFDVIVNNCSRCPNIDIRNFTIKELYLARSLSWVIKRSVDVAPKEKIPADVPIDVDTGSINESIDEILNSNWYRQSQDNPLLVANILQRISDRVINESIYSSS